MESVWQAQIGASSLVVQRVEADEIVTLGNIAERLGRSRESVRLLASGKRGPGGFPGAIGGPHRGRRRLWLWHEVAAWLTEHGYMDDEDAVDAARVLDGINGSLAMRRLRYRERERLVSFALQAKPKSLHYVRDGS